MVLSIDCAENIFKKTLDMVVNRHYGNGMVEILNGMIEKDEEEEMTKTTVRLPVHIYEQIEEIAKKNRRSVNSQIIILMEKAVLAEGE